jgi:hypothetical protein
LAKFSLIALHTDAFPVLTVTVTRAIRNFTLLVPDIAFFSLPTRFAIALSVDVVALPRAQKRTNALAAVISVKSRMALTLSKDASPMSVAPVNATLRQLLRVLRHKNHIVLVPVVVVHRDEPVALLHEEVRETTDQLLGASHLSMLLLVSQSGYHLHEVVVGVGGEGVPARVQPKRGAARYREVKSHIGGLFVEELDVEISKWRDRHCKLFSQSNLLEGGSIRREVSCGELLRKSTQALSRVWQVLTLCLLQGDDAGADHAAHPHVTLGINPMVNFCVDDSASLCYFSLAWSHQCRCYHKC